MRRIVSGLAIIPGVFAYAVAAGEITYLNCSAETANLKTGEELEVEANLEISLSESELLNTGELCGGGREMTYEISEDAIRLDCRNDKTAREMTLSRLTGRFEIVSRSLTDPDVFVSYVGTCTEVEPKF